MSRSSLVLAFVALGVLGQADPARADGPHKQSAPIDMASTVHGVAHAGQVLKVDVTLTPRIDVAALQLSFVGSDGLVLRPSDAQQNFGPLAAHESRTVSLLVTPQASGLQLLSVVAEVGGIANGATVRTFTIELPVDVSAASTSNAERKSAVTDATGQKIQSMHGVRR